jgi:predicted  nucleic acid-binding Zn-ribbon protein
MGPVLRGLTRLQEVENRLRSAKAKLARSRRRVQMQDNQLRALVNELEAKKEEMRLIRMQSDRLELDLKSREEHITKLRAALNMAKSNKEYSAILTELNTSKADNSKLETQVLELMKVLESDEAHCKEIRKQIDEQKNHLDEVRAESDGQSSQFEAEIAEVEKDWKKAAKEVPSEALTMFKRVADSYEGEAISFVEQSDGRMETYSCGGCCMGLTNECVNQLMSRDDIIRCGNCSRILVLKESNE